MAKRDKKHAKAAITIDISRLIDWLTEEYLDATLASDLIPDNVLDDYAAFRGDGLTVDEMLTVCDTFKLSPDIRNKAAEALRKLDTALQTRQAAQNAITAPAADAPTSDISQKPDDASELFDQIANDLDVMVTSGEAENDMLGMAHDIHVKLTELQNRYDVAHVNLYDLREQARVNEGLIHTMDTALGITKEQLAAKESELLHVKQLMVDAAAHASASDDKIKDLQDALDAANGDYGAVLNNLTAVRDERNYLQNMLNEMKQQDIRQDPRYKQAFKEDAEKMAARFGISKSFLNLDSMVDAAFANKADDTVFEPLDMSPEACTIRYWENIIRKYPNTETAKWLREQIDTNNVAAAISATPC